MQSEGLCENRAGNVSASGGLWPGRGLTTGARPGKGKEQQMSARHSLKDGKDGRLMEINQLKDEYAKLYEEMKDEFELRRARMEAVLNFQKPDIVPTLLCIEQPWYLPYLGIRYKDYFEDPDIMLRTELQGNLVCLKEFSDDRYFSGQIEVVPYLGHGLDASMAGCKIIFLEDDSSWISHEPLIRNKEDIDGWEIPTPSLESGLVPRLLEYSDYFKKTLGEDSNVGTGIARYSLHPFGIACHMFGVENFYVLMLEDSGKAHKLLEKTTDFIIEFHRLVRKVHHWDPRKPVTLAENYTAAISVDAYREFVIPYTKKVFGQFDGDGLGIDGDFTRFLPYLASELPELKRLSVSQETDIGTVREILGERVLFRGNINPVAIIQRGNRDTIFEEVRKMVDKATKGGKCASLIICNDDDIVPHTPVENIKATIEAGRMYGKCLLD